MSISKEKVFALFLKRSWHDTKKITLGTVCHYLATDLPQHEDGPNISWMNNGTSWAHVLNEEPYCTSTLPHASIRDKK